MKNRVSNILFASLLSFGLVGGVVGGAIHEHLKQGPIMAEAAYAPGFTPTKTYTFGDGATYYNGISATAEGTTLLSALQALNTSKRQTLVGYKKGGTSSSSSSFVYTDYSSVVGHDQNGAPYGNKISSFYTYTEATSFNKEHVWPNSRGGGTVEDDIHMARPTISAENSSRGNSFYVEGKNTNASGWDPKTAGYSEISRGESARIIFYCMVANPNLRLIDENGLPSSNQYYTTTMGKLSDMLKWNLNYAVTTREQNRNEGAEYLQGNRNPFIDHPEYACKIWGNTNSATKAVCSGQVTPPDDPETPQTEPIKLNITSKNLAIGESFDVIATTNDGSEIYWSFDDASYEALNFNLVTTTASGEAVKVTAIANGTGVITVASGNNLASCTIICGTGVKEEDNKPKDENKNKKTWIIVGASVGGALVLSGLIVLIVMITKKRPI